MSNATGTDLTSDQGAFVLIEGRSGLPLISSPSLLTRLHYFDGKFLRARDLEIEQSYLRWLAAFGNQAGGHGVVYGLGCLLRQDGGLLLGAGLAVDALGRLLWLPQPTPIDLDELIAATRRRESAATSSAEAGSAGFGECETAAGEETVEANEGYRYYLITLAHSEAYCGQEDVYGKLCEEACVTATERPWVVEGLVVRAAPWTAPAPLPASASVALDARHLRSRLASAYFAHEAAAVRSWISAPGLAFSGWCFGGQAAGAVGVPVALVARGGGTTLLDPWIPRRERMEEPARRYWAWRLGMRPWNVFLAQVLQFQCQLRGLFGPQAPAPGDGPCADEMELLRTTREELDEVLSGLEGDQVLFGTLSDLRDRLAQATRSFSQAPVPGDSILINRGIVELPPAGYLPVFPGRAVSVNRQARMLMGPGVDLRFCTVRRDYVPHAFEEAQHLERISLLHGIDHPDDKPEVDVLVPEGQIVEQRPVAAGGYEQLLGLSPLFREALYVLAAPPEQPPEQPGWWPDAPPPPDWFYGAARGEELAMGGSAFHFAGHTWTQSQGARLRDALDWSEAPGQFGGADADHEAPEGFFSRLFEGADHPMAVWLSLRSDLDPFALASQQSTPIGAEVVLRLAEPDGDPVLARLHFCGELQIEDQEETAQIQRAVTHLSGTLTANTRFFRSPPASPWVTSHEIEEQIVLLRRPREGRPADVEARIWRSGLLARVGSGWPGFQGNVTLQAWRRWPNPVLAGLLGTIFTLQQQEPRPDALFGALQWPNATALMPGRRAHTTAIQALRQINQLKRDTGFVIRKQRQLFPPPEPTEELVVRATRGWVLFHRRRDKVCHVEAPLPVEVRPRRYWLYHVPLTAVEEVQILSSNLSSGQTGIAERGPCGIVAFAPGISSVQTPHEAVRAAWRQRLGDASAELVYGAVASRAAAAQDGEALAEARLEGLAQVLSGVTPLAESPRFEVLDVPPGALAQGTDGAIVLATVAERTVCQRVYRLLGSREDQVEPLMRQLNAAPTAAAVDVLLARLTNGSYGEVVFEAETTEIVEAPELPEVWPRDQVLWGYLTVYGPTSDPHQAVEQAEAIARSLATEGRRLETFTVNLNFSLEPCPSIAVLLSEYPSPR